MDSLCRSIRPSPLSCPLYIYYTNFRIFFKLGSNVQLNKGLCKTHVSHASAQGQGHNWRSNIKQSNITQYVVSTIVLHLLKDFLQSWLKCSPQHSYVQNPCYPFAGFRSRLHLESKNLLRKYSYILTCIWIFLKLEKVFAWNLKCIWSVTIKICRSSFITLYSILMCPLYKLDTNGRIFFKLDSNVHPNWAMCRTHLTLMPAKGQGHTWRSKIDLENFLKF
jgi:hypothetical protein